MELNAESPSDVMIYLWLQLCSTD